MCQMCEAFGLKTESAARETGRIAKNDDGTYTLTLTERELTNLTFRLALSVLKER
jgi:hypothetical protein